MESQLEAEMENLQVFVKIAEEARRHRILRIALGEKDAKLNLQQPQQHSGSWGNKRDNWGNKRGGKGWQNDKGTSKGGFQPAMHQQQQQQWNAPRQQQQAPRTV